MTAADEPFDDDETETVAALQELARGDWLFDGQPVGRTGGEAALPGGRRPMTPEAEWQRWQEGYAAAVGSAADRGGVAAPLEPSDPPPGDPWRRGYLAAIADQTPTVTIAGDGQ